MSGDLPIEFRYRDAGGVESDVRLVSWGESGCYLRGVAAGKPKTYRKDRVLAYLNGGDGLLQDPFSPPPPKLVRSSGRAESSAPEILFTGFARGQRADLERRAEEAGLRVVKTPTLGLVFLCCGPTAGPAKVESARDRGAYIFGQAELFQLIETGELPDGDL